MVEVTDIAPVNRVNARKTIGVFISGLQDQYPTHVLETTIDAAHKQNLNVVAFLESEIESTLPDHIHFNANYKLVTSRNIDVLLLLASTLINFIDSDQIMAFCDQYDLPKISLGVKLPDTPSIVVNNRSGMCAAVRHLIEVHGLRRIAFICGPEHNDEAIKRLQAYRDMLEEHHIPFDPQLIVTGNWASEYGREAIHTLLDERKVEFDAIAAANDRIAIGALHELQRRNISVPDQVAITGFDDIGDASWTVPPLTTVRQPLYEEGAMAVKLALAALYGEAVPEDTMLEAEFVIRESCGCRADASATANLQLSVQQRVVNAMHLEVNRSLQFGYHMQAMSTMIRSLFAAPDMTTLSQTIVQALPDLGIKKCFFGLYDSESLDWSRIIVGYDDSNKDMDWAKDQPCVRTSEVVDYVLSSINGPSSLLVQALELNGTQIGVLIVDIDDPQLQRQFYEVLRQQLTSVFHARLMIRQLEEQRNSLEEQRTLLRTVIDNLPDYIFAKDREGRFLISNVAHARAAKVATPEELVGKRAAEFFEQELATQYDKDDEATIQSGQSLLNVQRRTVDEQGNPKWVLTTKVPLRDAQKKIVGLIGISRDISDLKRTEEALALARDQAIRASRLKSEFLANMSHEIRTPMNGIMGMNALLLETDLTDEQREFSETIHVSSDTLLTIINDILDFSKIEADKLVLEKIKFEPVALVEGTGELLALIAHNKNVALMTYIDPHIPKVLLGDPVRLQQVLLNLINNAVKFTERGEVVVRAELESCVDNQATIRFTVKDTGIGISDDARALMFQPFTQADSTTTRKYGGTGLGLAISKRLAELMGGEIGVESVPGDGSTFWFTAQFGCLPEERQVDDTFLDEVKVLICEQHRGLCEIISQYLASWGMANTSINTADGVLAALTAAVEANKPYDVALMNYSLPGFDEFALAQAIKHNPMLAHTQLILLATADRKGLAETASHNGFSAYLSKPIKQSQLFNAIEAVKHGDVDTKLNYVAHRFVKPNTGDSAATKTELSSARILLVEDNAINKKVALLQLKKLGYVADTANNGKEAVAIIRGAKYAYDLVLMDCQMPEMDGYEATRVIRSEEKDSAQHLTIIAMTANAMEGDRDICIQAGMDDYIPKPIKPNNLKLVIDRWLSPGELVRTPRILLQAK
ncbi:MAG: response regulator [Chloroflexota bacterium]